MSKYVAGTIIALGTTFGNALGLTLQKQAHVAMERLRYEAKARGQPPPLARVASQKRWLVGLAFMSAASVASLAVFALVGQSVASTFASITIIWNLLLSVALLGEKGQRIDVAIAGVMILGAVLAVVFGRGGQTSGFLTVDDLLVTLQRTLVYVCFGLYLTAIVLLAAYIAWADSHVDRIGRHSWRWRASLLARAVNAGIFSGFVGFFSKGSVNIFAASIGSGASGNLNRYEPWLFLFLLPVSLVFQVLYLNSALKHFRATEAVPLYQSQVVLWGVLFGVTLYAELDGKSGGSIALFLIGIGVIMFGIGLVFIKQRREGMASAAQKEALLAGHAARTAKRAAAAAATRRAASFWDEGDYRVLLALSAAVGRWGLPPLLQQLPAPPHPTGLGGDGSGQRMQVRMSQDPGGGWGSPSAAAAAAAAAAQASDGAYRPLHLQRSVLRTRAWSAPPKDTRKPRQWSVQHTKLSVNASGSSSGGVSARGPAAAPLASPSLPQAWVPVRSARTGWSTALVSLQLLQLLPEETPPSSSGSVRASSRSRSDGDSILPPPAWLLHKAGPRPVLLPAPAPPPGQPQPASHASSQAPAASSSPGPSGALLKRPLSAALNAGRSWWARLTTVLRGPAFGWKLPLAPELSPTSSARQEARSLQRALTGAFNATYGNGVVVPARASATQEAPVLDAATRRTVALAELALQAQLILPQLLDTASATPAGSPAPLPETKGAPHPDAGGATKASPAPQPVQRQSALYTLGLVLQGQPLGASGRWGAGSGDLPRGQVLLRAAGVQRLLLPLPGGTTAAGSGPFIRPRRRMSVSLQQPEATTQHTGTGQPSFAAAAPPPPQPGGTPPPSTYPTPSAPAAPAEPPPPLTAQVLTTPLLPPMVPAEQRDSTRTLPTRMPVRLTSAGPPPQEPLLPLSAQTTHGSGDSASRLSVSSQSGGPQSETLSRRLAAALRSNLALVPALGAHSGWDVLPPDSMDAAASGQGEQVSVLPSPSPAPLARGDAGGGEAEEGKPRGSSRGSGGGSILASRHSRRAREEGAEQADEDALSGSGQASQRVAPITGGELGPGPEGREGTVRSGGGASSPDLTVFTSPQELAYSAAQGGYTTAGRTSELDDSASLLLSGGPSRRLSDFTSDAFPLGSGEGGATAAPPLPPQQMHSQLAADTNAPVAPPSRSSRAPRSAAASIPAAGAPVSPLPPAPRRCLLLPLLGVQHLQYDPSLLCSIVASRSYQRPRRGRSAAASPPQHPPPAAGTAASPGK